MTHVLDISDYEPGEQVGASAPQVQAAVIDSSPLQAAAAAVGDGTAVAVEGMETAIMAVSGTFVGTVVFEGLGPDDVWYTLQAKPVGGHVLVQSVTAAGAWIVHVAGYTSVRARVSAYTSGSITVAATLVSTGNHADVQNVAFREKLDAVNDAITAYPLGHSVNMVAADTLIKTGSGVLHTVTLSCNDAAPTAGSIIIYDNTAESGTVLFNHTFTTTPFVPTTLVLDVAFATGLYVGFTTTADVNATISWR
jgi:hypothetical protein